MGTQDSTARHILSQVEGAGTVRIRKMFGEYALYCNDKVVALICDDTLYVKPTKAGREMLGTVEEAPPYPGSKPFYVIDESRGEDRQWLSELIRVTEKAVPVPKPKKRI